VGAGREGQGGKSTAVYEPAPSKYPGLRERVKPSSGQQGARSSWPTSMDPIKYASAALTRGGHREEDLANLLLARSSLRKFLESRHKHAIGVPGIVSVIRSHANFFREQFPIALPHSPFKDVFTGFGPNSKKKRKKNSTWLPGAIRPSTSKSGLLSSALHRLRNCPLHSACTAPAEPRAAAGRCLLRKKAPR